MAVTVSLLNMKGGVGKTTLSANIAWCLARDNHKRCLLVDLDPQFNASQYLMTYEEWEHHKTSKGTVADIILDSNCYGPARRGQCSDADSGF